MGIVCQPESTKAEYADSAPLPLTVLLKNAGASADSKSLNALYTPIVLVTVVGRIPVTGIGELSQAMLLADLVVVSGLSQLLEARIDGGGTPGTSLRNMMVMKMMTRNVKMTI